MLAELVSQAQSAPSTNPAVVAITKEAQWIQEMATKHKISAEGFPNARLVELIQEMGVLQLSAPNTTAAVLPVTASRAAEASLTTPAAQTSAATTMSSLSTSQPPGQKQSWVAHSEDGESSAPTTLTASPTSGDTPGSHQTTDLLTASTTSASAPRNDPVPQQAVQRAHRKRARLPTTPQKPHPYTSGQKTASSPASTTAQVDLLQKSVSDQQTQINSITNALSTQKDSDFSIVMGVGSLIVGTGVTDYKNASNILEATSLGRATPQLMTGVAFRSKIPSLTRPWRATTNLCTTTAATQNAVKSTDQTDQTNTDNSKCIQTWQHHPWNFS